MRSRSPLFEDYALGFWLFDFLLAMIYDLAKDNGRNDIYVFARHRPFPPHFAAQLFNYTPLLRFASTVCI
jgi:hypothetical protein